MSEADDEHLVHEVAGPDLTALQTAGALGVGVNSLLVLGVIPVLLGSLAELERALLGEGGHNSGAAAIGD